MQSEKLKWHFLRFLLVTVFVGEIQGASCADDFEASLNSSSLYNGKDFFIITRRQCNDQDKAAHVCDKHGPHLNA